MKLKYWLYTVAGLTLGILLYLFKFDGVEQIQEFLESPSIEVRSTSRTFSRNYFAGEKLRFSITNVETPRVFWVFDEAEIVPGHVETEYLFAYSPELLSSQSVDHRVDAFFKVDGDYQSTHRLVRVENLDIQAKVQEALDRLHLSYPQELSERFTLSRAALASFGEGHFEDDATLDLLQGDTIEAARGRLVEVTWNLDGDFLGRYATLLGSSRRPWLELEFTDRRNREKLVFVNPLEPTPAVDDGITPR